MRISEKRRAELYAAIRDAIVDLRIDYENHSTRYHTISFDVDKALFHLESKIWRKVHAALNLEGTP